MKKILTLSLVGAAILAAGCTRIETGEVGLRVRLDKQISQTELEPGSFNQVLIGDVITFPVREIKVSVDNKRPQTADGSLLADFDFTVIYSINPSSVSELYTTKSKGFHKHDGNDWVLMYQYIETIANSAAFKAVRKFEALKINDNRSELEQAIKHNMQEALIEEKLATALTITQVQIRSTDLAPEIIASSNAVITQQNALKAKIIEVQNAEQEAKRIAMLNSNAKAIDYMNAQANLTIAQAVAAGKVTTIIVPYDFKGIVNAGSNIK